VATLINVSFTLGISIDIKFDIDIESGHIDIGSFTRFGIFLLLQHLNKFLALQTVVH
jgi:hypothetical protein